MAELACIKMALCKCSQEQPVFQFMEYPRNLHIHLSYTTRDFFKNFILRFIFALFLYEFLLCFLLFYFSGKSHQFCGYFS
jgi:hypothetical protein